MGRSVDEEWAAAGLLDVVAERRGARLELLEYLAEQGASVAEMQAAAAQGRLFALANDRLLARPSIPLNAQDLAIVVGSSPERAVQLAGVLGFPVPDREPVALTFEEVTAAAVLNNLAELLGVDRALSLGRVLYSAMDTVAEAISATVRSAFPEASVALSDEASAGRHLTKRNMQLRNLDLVFMPVLIHRVDEARKRFEQSGGYDIVLEGRTRIAIGFVDLSGFTTLSVEVGLHEIEQLLTRFEATVRTAATEHKVRVVKFIGDEAMIVAPSTDDLIDVIVDILAEPMGLPADRVKARAGVSFGDVLARDGDYFGPDVNLAARLVTAAPPGTVMLSQAAREVLHRARASMVAHDKLLVKGLSSPVPTWLIRP